MGLLQKLIEAARVLPTFPYRAGKPPDRVPPTPQVEGADQPAAPAPGPAEEVLPVPHPAQPLPPRRRVDGPVPNRRLTVRERLRAVEELVRIAEEGEQDPDKLVPRILKEIREIDRSLGEADTRRDVGEFSDRDNPVRILAAQESAAAKEDTLRQLSELQARADKVRSDSIKKNAPPMTAESARDDLADQPVEQLSAGDPNELEDAALEQSRFDGRIKNIEERGRQNQRALAETAPVKKTKAEIMADLSAAARPKSPSTESGGRTLGELATEARGDRPPPPNRPGAPADYSPTPLKSEALLAPGDYEGVGVSIVVQPALLADGGTMGVPTVVANVPEIDPVTGQKVTKPRILQGDLYAPRQDANGFDYLLIQNGRPFIIPGDGGRLRAVTQNELASIQHMFEPTPSSNMEYQQAVATGDAVRGMSSKELANVGKLPPETPSTPRSSTLIDETASAEPAGPAGPDGLTRATRRVVKPLESGSVGPRSRLTDEDYRTRFAGVAGPLSEYFKNRRSPEVQGADSAISEAFGAFDKALPTKRLEKLSQLGIVDTKNTPLDKLREAYGSDDLPYLPEASITPTDTEIDARLGALEAARRNLEEVHDANQRGLQTGDPIDPALIDQAEAEYNDALGQINTAGGSGPSTRGGPTRFGDGDYVPAYAQQLVADMRSTAGSVEGAENATPTFSRYVELREELQQRLQKAEAFAPKIARTDGDGVTRMVPQSTAEAEQLRAALQWLYETYEPRLREAYGSGFSEVVQRGDDSLTNLRKSFGEMRRLGFEPNQRVADALTQKVLEIDNALERMNDQLATITKQHGNQADNPRALQYAENLKQGMSRLTEIRDTLESEVDRALLSGAGPRITNEGTKFPRGAANEMTRLGAENIKGYQELAGDYGTDNMTLAEMIEKAEQFEADPEFKDPSFDIEPYAPKPRAPQATEGTMAGLRALRQYMRSRGSKEIPAWMLDQLEGRSGASRSISSENLAKLEDLEARIDAATTPAERGKLRQERDQIVAAMEEAAERDSGRPNQAETLAMEEARAGAAGSESAAPGTVDNNFYFRNQADQPFVEDLIKASKPDFKGEVSPQAQSVLDSAKSLGGLEELYIRGYLRSAHGPGAERTYSQFRDQAMKAQRQAEQMEGALSREAIRRGYASVEELVAAAEAGEVGGRDRLDPRTRYDQDLNKRVVETSRKAAVLRRDSVNSMNAANAELEALAPGLREQIGGQLQEFVAPQRPSSPTQAGPTEDSVSQAVNANSGMNDPFVGLDIKADAKLREVVKYLRNTNNLDTPLTADDIADLKILVSRSGSSPEKMRQVQAYIEQFAPQKSSIPEASSPEDAARFGRNYNRQPSNQETVTVSGAEASEVSRSLQQQLDTFQRELDQAYDVIQEYGADRPDFNVNSLDPAVSNEVRRALEIEQIAAQGYEKKLQDAIEKADEAAQYTLDSSRLRADLTPLRQRPEGFDPETAKLMEGYPFYAEGTAANEAALYGLATGKFARSDILGENYGLYGQTRESIQQRLATAEQKLKTLVGEDSLTLDDDMVGATENLSLLDRATKQRNELDEQLHSMERGAFRPIDFENSLTRRDAIDAAAKEYQDALAMSEAINGEGLADLNATVKTYRTDKKDNGYAVIEIPESVSAANTGVEGMKATPLSYSLYVPISFADDYGGSLVGGRRVQVDPGKQGPEAFVTEVRSNERGDVDWATGQTKARRTVPATIERPKIVLPTDPEEIGPTRPPEGPQPQPEPPPPEPEPKASGLRTALNTAKKVGAITAGASLVAGAGAGVANLARERQKQQAAVEEGGKLLKAPMPEPAKPTPKKATKAPENRLDLLLEGT